MKSKPGLIAIADGSWIGDAELVQHLLVSFVPGYNIVLVAIGGSYKILYFSVFGRQIYIDVDSKTRATRPFYDDTLLE